VATKKTRTSGSGKNSKKKSSRPMGRPRKTKPKTVPKKERMKKKKEILSLVPTVAFIIEEPYFEPFAVKYSHNAWWMNQEKVLKLFDAYRYDCTDLEACAEAGISIGQLEYFQKEHESFLGIKSALKTLPTSTARRTVVNKMKTDAGLAMEYLKNKRSDEFNTRQRVDNFVNPMFKEGAVIQINRYDPSKHKKGSNEKSK